MEHYGQGQIKKEKEYLVENREEISSGLLTALSKKDNRRLSELIERVLEDTVTFLSDLERKEKSREEFPLFIETMEAQKDLENIYFYYLLEKAKKECSLPPYFLRSYHLPR